MLNLYFVVFFPFLISFLLTLICVPISLFFLRKYKIVDDPKKHKHPAILHKAPIPRGGGIPFFIGILLTSLIFIPFSKLISAVFFASFVSLIVGVLDDKYDLSPYIRFFINILCAVFVVYFGVNVAFITNPFGGILYLNTLELPFINIPTLTLFFNYYPAKIFPGYGATAIYLLLAVASILSSAKLATAILVMGIPMTDGVFTILRRLASGKSPFWHDKKHLHHLLLSLGFGQRRVALFYWIVSAILGALSLILSSKGKLFAIIMLVIIAWGTILFLHLLIRKIDDK